MGISRADADEIKRLCREYANATAGFVARGIPSTRRKRDELLAFVDSLTVEPPPIASLKDLAALSMAAAEAKFGPAFARPVEPPTPAETPEPLVWHETTPDAPPLSDALAWEPVLCAHCGNPFTVPSAQKRSAVPGEETSR